MAFVVLNMLPPFAKFNLLTGSCENRKILIAKNLSSLKHWPRFLVMPGICVEFSKKDVFYAFISRNGHSFLFQSVNPIFIGKDLGVIYLFVDSSDAIAYCDKNRNMMSLLIILRFFSDLRKNKFKEVRVSHSQKILQTISQQSSPPPKLKQN